MSTAAAWLVALVSGGLWGLCFGREPFLLAPWMALVPLLLLLGRRRAALLGFFHGLACWLAAIPWIVPTLRDYGQLPTWASVAGLVALSGFLASYHAMFTALGRRVWRARGTTALIGLPALWVVTEWLRAHLFSGFPWNLAGQALVEVPGALQLSGWVGIYGVSFILVLVNVALAIGLRERCWRLPAGVAATCLLLLAIGARWAPPKVASDRGEAVAMRLLQPDFSVSMTWEPRRAAEDYTDLFAMSDSACDRFGALVIWPESASWPYSYTRDAAFRRDVDQFAQRRCPLLLNTSTSEGDETRNSVLLVADDGVEGAYAKHHLVPFGEYVPLARWLPFLPRIARTAGDFSPGTDLSPISWRDEELAVAICYEITFPEEVARRVQLGGTILVTVTNDGWYGDSSAPWQHFYASRFRAAENGRFLVRAALTGVSAVVGPDGSIVEMLGVGERGTLRAQVFGLRMRTLYSRAPWLLPMLSLVVAGSAIFFSRKEAL